MNKVAIFGLGAMGTVITKYLLANTNNQLSYFNRSTKKSIRILFNDQLLTLPIDKINQNIGPYDWMVVCLKTYHLAEAKRSIKKLIGPKTKIAVFRNGLNLQADFADILPVSNILETIIDCPTQLDSNGNYLQLKTPKLILPKSSLAKEFQNLFTNSNIQIQLIKSFKTAQWKKLIESSSIGSLQALTGKTSVIFKDPKMMVEYRKLVTEGILVANAEGVRIPQNFLEELIEKLKTYPDHKGSSMLSDKLAGRQLELNAKIGVVVELGTRHQISIPNSERIYKRLL